MIGSIQSNIVPATGRTGFPADLLVTLDRSRPRSFGPARTGPARRDRTRVLAPGAALPPSRVLARELDVSRSVVAEAYEQLVTEGYLQARGGSGTRGPGAGHRQPPAAPALPFWPVPACRYGATPASGLPDPALFPRQDWLHHYRDVLREMPDSGLLYPEPRGAPELRTALAAYLGRVRGVRATADQVADLRRFLPGPDCCAAPLGLRGVRRIAVEDPCFSSTAGDSGGPACSRYRCPWTSRDCRPRAWPGWTRARCCCRPPTPIRAASCSPPTGASSCSAGHAPPARW